MLDGASRLDPLVAAAAADGQPALAITDHGNMYGTLDFYQGLPQPRHQADHRYRGIHGRMSIGASDRRAAARSTTPAAAPTAGKKALLPPDRCWPRTTRAIKNLIQLSSKAFLEGYYYKPRVDWEVLDRSTARGSSPRPAVLAVRYSSR